MNFGTALVLVIVLALVAVAVRSVLKKRSSGGCHGGSNTAASGCSGCSGCSGHAKVYGINVDAAGMPISSDGGSCCHHADAK